jgi:hypothetical protein
MGCEITITITVRFVKLCESGVKVPESERMVRSEFNVKTMNGKV